jgi:hypothetical protein
MSEDINKKKTRCVKYYQLHKDEIKKRIKKYLAKASKKAIKSKWQKKYRKLYPEKRIAHYKIYNALKSKKIHRNPCVVCGNNDVEAHHANYLNPLKIIWLCPTHHCQIHQKKDIMLFPKYQFANLGDGSFINHLNVCGRTSA